jgi:hypothetical protein
VVSGSSIVKLLLKSVIKCVFLKKRIPTFAQSNSVFTEPLVAYVTAWSFAAIVFGDCMDISLCTYRILRGNVGLVILENFSGFVDKLYNKIESNMILQSSNDSNIKLFSNL